MQPLALKRSSKASSQRGVMLLEALIAILIFSLGILALVGLQAASIQNTTDAKYRTDAMFLANQIVGQMWVDRTNLADYADGTNSKRVAWKQTIDSTLPGADGDIQVNGTQVTVTVTWQPTGQDKQTTDPKKKHRYIAVANIN
jgi:type IV pilus assembly protein PilV